MLKSTPKGERNDIEPNKNKLKKRRRRTHGLKNKGMFEYLIGYVGIYTKNSLFSQINHHTTNLN